VACGLCGTRLPKEEEIAMRADRPLIVAVIFLSVGLGLIFGYCHGTTGFSFAYPFSGSMLHADFTLNGPAVPGGAACVIIGVLLLIWAFFAAVVNLFAGRDRLEQRERYSVVPVAERTVYTEASDEEDGHFWSRPSSKSHI
jgi:hypothetical protein